MQKNYLIAKALCQVKEDGHLQLPRPPHPPQAQKKNATYCMISLTLQPRKGKTTGMENRLVVLGTGRGGEGTDLGETGERYCSKS